jgi:endonuclease-3
MAELQPPIRTILDRLYTRYGEPQTPGADDLLGTLVRTILSQNTTRQNTDRAFGRLLDHFGADWGRIERAATDEVIDQVAVAGLAGQKAPRIQAILEQIRRETGDYSLAFLRDRSIEEAEAYLLDFKGVGPKTASYTLMYAAEMPLFAMDTHILRICQRLGWIEASLSSKKAHQQMLPHIPDGEHYPAHIALIRHGRQTCHARNPECDDCPIARTCPSADDTVG